MEQRGIKSSEFEARSGDSATNLLFNMSSAVNLTEQFATNKSTTSVEGFDRLAIVQLMCYSIITAAGLIGNTLICLAVFKRRRLRITDVFVLNLAATDLATCVISIPFDFVERLVKEWPFGNVLCKIVYPLQTILMAVSVYTLLFMRWERHRSVMPPFKPKIKAKRAVTIVFILWAASISLVGPYIAILKAETSDGVTQCMENWPKKYHPKVFTLAVFIALYVLPLFVITANYIRISQKLWRDIQRMHKAIGERKRNGKKPLVQARAQRNMRIVRIFIIAVIAFSLCMLPNHIMWIWKDFGSEKDLRYFGTIINFCYILVYSNSAINPFIFVFLHRRYCRDIFSPCGTVKMLVISCLRFRSQETCSNANIYRKSKISRRRERRSQRKSNHLPYTMQLATPRSARSTYAARKLLWNNSYWCKELIPNLEAKEYRVSFRNEPLQSLKDGEDVDGGNDERNQVSTKKVNFGEVVRIEAQ